MIQLGSVLVLCGVLAVVKFDFKGKKDCQLDSWLVQNHSVLAAMLS